MVDLIAIQGAITGLKTARDIAKTAIGLRDAAMLQEKVIELNDAILSAQESALNAQADQLALAKRIDDLERQLAQSEAWKREQERYQLHRYEPGVFVYALKPDMAQGEPPHELCQTCYQQGKKSILNHSEPNSGRTKLHCPSCGWEDHIGRWITPTVRGSRGGGGPNSWMGA